MLEEHKDVIRKCLINEKEVIIEKKPQTITKGPCSKVVDSKCKAYIDPSSKWRNEKDCPLASHIIYKEDEVNFKLNPIKASKKNRG